MKVHGTRRVLAGAVLTVAALSGGTAAASSYPPDDPTPTTVSVGGVSGVLDPAIADPADPAGAQLPATGSDADPMLLVAGSAVAAGAGLLVATRLRRRPAS